LEDLDENEVGDALGLWLESHQRELHDFVDLDPHPGCRG
jgi:hypothetical protein